MTAPLVYSWTGAAMVPHPRHAKRCDQEHEVGEFYQLETVEERSRESHDHYFARLDELFDTLHENLLMEFPSREHLRKFALIYTGFCKINKFVMASHQEAMSLAATLSDEDEYAVVEVSGNVVTRRTARTQRARGKDRMDKKDFQASKTAVLDYVEHLIGSPPIAPEPSPADRTDEQALAGTSSATMNEGK